MWILRPHLLRSKDYNKLSRIFQKYGFKTRSHSPTVYAKALMKRVTLGTSWRSLESEFHIHHSALLRFYEYARESGMLREIFHTLIERRICLYIGQRQHISAADLDSSEEILQLTQAEFESIL